MFSVCLHRKSYYRWGAKIIPETRLDYQALRVVLKASRNTGAVEIHERHQRLTFAQWKVSIVSEAAFIAWHQDCVLYSGLEFITCGFISSCLVWSV